MYLTVKGLSAYLGFANIDTQRKWRENKEIPFYQFDRQILYRKSDVDKFVERHRITPRNYTKIEQN